MFGSAGFATITFAAFGDLVADSIDPFRAACRARLAEHMAEAGIDWLLIDLLNTGENPDVSQNFIDIEFPGGSELQFTFGAPGNNFHDEVGQITIYVKTRLGAGTTVRNTAESYAQMLRDRFRNDRFAADVGTVRIRTVAAMGAGQDEAGLWVEAVALGYQIFNVG